MSAAGSWRGARSQPRTVPGYAGPLTALLVLTCMAGCMRSRPLIYLDDEWNTAYTRNTCYLYLPQADRDPGLGDCLARQAAALQAFTQALRAQLRTQSACAAVLIANPDVAQLAPPGKGFWRLLLSLDDLQGRQEKWDLMRPENGGIRHGAGDAAAMARDVCTVAGGHD